MNQLQTIPSELKEQWDLRSWFTAHLIPRLYAARTIRLDDERIQGLCAMLADADFDERQSKIAEEWILRGDWTFKGKNFDLMYNDFYPTDDQRSGIAKPKVSLKIADNSSERDKMLTHMRTKIKDKDGFDVTREIYANQLKMYIEQGLTDISEWSSRINNGVELYSLKFQ